MGHRDPVGRVHIEGLGFRRAGAASGGITNMADPHITHQSQHVTGMKAIPHQAVILAQKKLVVLDGYDSGSILPPMLQHRESIIQLLVDVGLSNNTNTTAHARYLTW